MSKAKYWYTPIPEGEGDTTLRMKQVLMVDVKLVEILDNNKDIKKVFLVLGGAETQLRLPYVPIGIGNSESPLGCLLSFSPKDKATGGYSICSFVLT